MTSSGPLLQCSCVSSGTSAGLAAKELNKNTLNATAASGAALSFSLCVLKSVLARLRPLHSHNSGAQNWSNEMRLMKMKRERWKSAWERRQGSRVNLTAASVFIWLSV